MRREEKTIHFNFIKGLLREAYSRRLGLNLDGKKYVFRDWKVNDIVVEQLMSYGFKILPEMFVDIRLPSATNVFCSLSNHNPLKPTNIETKKITLLDEVVKIIQENMNKTLQKYLKNMQELTFNEKMSYYDLFEIINTWLKIDLETLKKILGDNELANKIIKQACNISKQECEVITKKLNELIKFKINNLAKDNLQLEISKFISEMPFSLKSGLDEANKKIIYKLKNLASITNEDVTRPKYIFNRLEEMANNTLGEAIIDRSKEQAQYLGHWVDRNYLQTVDFNEMLATWLHEIQHKAGRIWHSRIYICTYRFNRSFK